MHVFTHRSGNCVVVFITCLICLSNLLWAEGWRLCFKWRGIKDDGVMRQSKPMIGMVLGCLAVGLAHGADPISEADAWLTGPIRLPETVATAVPDSGLSSVAVRLSGEALAVTWNAEAATNGLGFVWFSPAASGSGASRPWFRREASWKGDRFVAEIPVVDLDEPIIYFAAMRSTDGQETVSRVRVCVPRGLNLSKPTAPRRAFLEGFEEEAWNWKNLDERATVKRIAAGRASGHALEVGISTGQRSAAVATPLVRGLTALRVSAHGFSVWLRGSAAGINIRVLAMAHAGTDRQISAAFPGTVAPLETWTRFDFRFDQLEGFPLGALDQIVFEIVGQGPCSVRFDDLEWLGL